MLPALSDAFIKGALDIKFNINFHSTAELLPNVALRNFQSYPGTDFQTKRGPKIEPGGTPGDRMSKLETPGATFHRVNTVQHLIPPLGKEKFVDSRASLPLKSVIDGK